MRLAPIVLTLAIAFPALAGCAAPDESLAASSVGALPVATPARLAVAGLEVPATAEVGVPVTVTARVANAGGAAGQADVRLYAGSSLVATQAVDVAAGETKSVALAFTAARGGRVALEASVPGAPAAAAALEVSAPALGKISWRHTPSGCTGEIALDAWFTNEGDAVARGVVATLSVVDVDGRTWDSATIEVGDVAIGEQGHASATLTAYDRCNVKDAYRFDMRLAPLFGEPAKLRTATVDL